MPGTLHGLESLRGVGAKRRRQLLRRFGGAAAVERASLEELQEVLGPRLGESVHGQLAGDGEEGD